MKKISNQKVCGGSKKNIAFHYKLEWCQPEARKIKFNLPTDFGYGGYAIYDGETEVEYRADIWSNQDLLDFTMTVEAGHHVIEVIGGEGCCDGNR